MKVNFFVISFFLTFFSSMAFVQSTNPINLNADQLNEVKNLFNKEDSQFDQDIISDSNKESIDNNSGLIDANKGKNKKYGYDFISSSPTSIAATGDLPLPNEYIISIRDQISILLSGSKDELFDLSVKLDGTILFPEIGSVSVAGKSLGEVKKNLTSLVSRTFIGVQIDISIKNLSAKKISIVGAVKSPGTYLVNPFTTITSALAYSGGVSDIGTLRNIKLKRINGEVFNFDLYQLLIKGDRSKDLTIQAGDVILIDPANQFIKLSGSVVRPAIYEMKENESLEDLINFGLGFQSTANKSNISMEIIDLNSSSILSKNTDNLNTKLNNVISVNVFSYRNKSASGIYVFGAVKESGFKELNQNDTLEKIIQELEFVNVYPWLAVLEQFDEENLIKSSILFNLKDPNTFKSIKLLPNSRIFFSDLNERKYDVNPVSASLIDDYQLLLNHKQESYSLPVYGKFSVKSFVNYLGLDMSDVEKEATYVNPSESLIVKSDYQNMNFTASKYHTVTFRSPINDLINVTILGSIDYPGTYKMNASSTLQDLYNMIGNFKSEAFKKGIIFTRSSIRERQLKAIEKTKRDLKDAIAISIQKGNEIGDIDIISALSETIEPDNLGRIAGDFHPDSISARNTILLDNDVITVPKNPNSINVLGEVLNPIAFDYKKNLNIYSAISSAGGFKDYADKTKIYVIKANGKVVRQRKNSFLKIATIGIFPRSLKLEPGDSVIVPRKIIISNPISQTLLPITTILSDLAFTAAALDSLKD